jgi:hypothetical protein
VKQTEFNQEKNMAKKTAKKVDYIVKDMSLAAFGRKEIELAEWKCRA